MNEERTIESLNRVIQGDALDVLKTLESHSIDAICCDPPAGIAFMGKDWDKDKGNRDNWIAWLAEIMREGLRCLKPGGHAFVWALPRTSHWTATALEDAGFEIRDVCVHLFGSGMPKSLDISKAIDRCLNAEREKVKSPITTHTTAGKGFSNEIDERPWMTKAREIGYHEHAGPAPVTPEARQWQGFGTNLKPASEHWILCRAPLAEKNIAAQVLATGTGAINIDASRIDGSVPSVPQPQGGNGSMYGFKNGIGRNGEISHPHPQGRWPANTLFSHTIFCTDSACVEGCPVKLLDEQSGIRKSGAKKRFSTIGFGRTENHIIDSPSIYEASEGGASRYFATFQPTEDDYAPFVYASKASRAERNRGCEGLPEKAKPRPTTNTERCIKCGGWHSSAQGIINRPNSTCQCDNPEFEVHQLKPHTNTHPTVKPLALMRYLVTMITPPGGVVLDCFMGSGSTGVAAIMSGFQFIGIDQDESYCEIARARINAWRMSHEQ